MQIRIGLEINNEGKDIAWALDFPGCFASGADRSEALIRLARELVDYTAWVNGHAGREQMILGDFDLRVVDTWEVYTIDDALELADGGYAVNAWFRQDWKPLSAGEIAHALDLLRWSRSDLLGVAGSLEDAVLDLKQPEERWSIRGILRHVANAEWWYLDRLGLAGFTRDALPQVYTERLAVVRARLEEVLPGLAGANQVVGKDGEFWSPRKVLRRTLWHEIDHRQHILKLLSTR